jgi:xanthine dehydrogenase YagS FAD-binding subunit
MKPFAYTRAASAAEAVEAASRPGVAILAGGTELLNWMRIGVSEPGAVVDIVRLPRGGEIRLDRDVVHVGALATLDDVASNELVRDRFPVLRQAIHQSASAQLRNLATIGGNPLQSTRCPYFRSESPTPCNKRRPGSGCAARHGITDTHAIFGWTDACVAVQPSDPATALVALDSIVVTADPNGGRRLAINDLHVLPAEDPTVHHVLRPGEIIVEIEISGAARASAYIKVRERESYEFALVSAAVALDLDGDLITRARIAVGSVAMKPWRLERAERLLAGVRVGSAEVEESLSAAFAEARPLPGSEYKVPLAKNAVLSAIDQAVRP